MTLPQGRILHDDASLPIEIAASASRPRFPDGRIALEPVVEASLQAERLLAEAQRKASAMIDQARGEQEQARAQARQQGLNDATAQLASAWLELRAREADADLKAQARSVALARMLAERLLGEALRLEPATVVNLAREAMRTMWRADRVTLEVHPDDVSVLEANLAKLPMEPELIQVVAAPDRLPGSVRIVSTLGVIEASMKAQLDRLLVAAQEGPG